MGYSGLVVVARTGDIRLDELAPAIALSVFDSDCAFATAAGPSGSAVQFHLNEAMVRALANDDGFEPLNGQAAIGLPGWAEEAGLVTDSDRLAAALEDSPGPFGDGILEFTEALGIQKLPARRSRLR